MVDFSANVNNMLYFLLATLPYKCIAAVGNSFITAKE